MREFDGLQPDLEDRPTILITSSTANDTYWLDIALPSLRILCPEFNVELLRRAEKGLSVVSEKARRHYCPLEGKAFLGNSIGTKDSPRSGILGAVIKMEREFIELG